MYTHPTHHFRSLHAKGELSILRDYRLSAKSWSCVSIYHQSKLAADIPYMRCLHLLSCIYLSMAATCLRDQERRHGWQIDAMVATTSTRKDPTLSNEMICSPRKEPAGGPVRSKSGSSPTSNKQISSLVIDTRNDRESEKNYGDAHRVAVLARSVSPTSAAFSKLISGNNNKQKLRAVQLVTSQYGAVSPKSRPNRIDKKSNAAESLRRPQPVQDCRDQCRQ